MIARTGAIGLIAFWAVMMGWLGWHDIWPAWTAQEPPALGFQNLGNMESDRTQAGIFDHRNRRVGTSWTTHTRLGGGILRQDCLWIEKFSAMPPTRIMIDSTFDPDGQLDGIEAHVSGVGFPIKLVGERFPREFAFMLKVGRAPPRKFKIPHSHAGAFGDVFKPFAVLHDLRVGQSWRMQVFNPLAAAIGFGETFTPVLVRVTRTETLVRDGMAEECFVVETSGSRALVGPDGQVREQSVEMPLGGTITIRDEPYDAVIHMVIKGLKLDLATEVPDGG